MKRTIKPFAVEIRRGGRAMKPLGQSWAALVQEADQPRAKPWPSTGQELAESLQEPERPLDAEVVATGRILPALDVLERRVATAEPEPEPPRAVEFNAELPNEHEARPEQVVAAPLFDAAAIAATLMLQEDRTRLPRHVFRSGERWKSRLPAIVVGRVQRMRRGKAIRNPAE